MTPFDVYKTYLGFKNHFTKPNYDYFKYCGKSKASLESFYKRKDRFFFERISRQKNDEEIQKYFIANFVECDDPQTLWIGEIIKTGEDVYKNWVKKIQSLTYLFKTESEIFIRKDNFYDFFKCKKGQHPEVLKKYLERAVSLETILILNKIFNYVEKYDYKINDPIWNFVSLRIKKYDPFINIEVAKYKKILREIIL